MNIKKFKNEITAIVSLIVLAFSGYFWLDSEYAKAGEVKEIKQSVRYMQTEYQRDVTQERIWKIVDRYDCQGDEMFLCKKSMPDTVKEELRTLIRKKLELEERIKKIE